MLLQYFLDIVILKTENFDQRILYKKGFNFPPISSHSWNHTIISRIAPVLRLNNFFLEYFLLFTLSW